MIISKTRALIKRLFNSFARDSFFCLAVASIILALLLGSTAFDFGKSKQGFLASASSQFPGGPFISQQDISYLESPDLAVVQGNALRAVAVPGTLTPKALGSLVGSEFDFSPNKEIVEYIVEPGDTIWSIAEEFDISLQTILWANNLNKNSLIRPGKKLIILPVSGLLHHVKKGETISGMAERYKARVSQIIAFNALSFAGDIFIGDILVIPNGRMPVARQRIAPQLVPLAQSYFICPVSPPCRITQDLHWYNAIDFSHGKCGEPVYAAAAGKVLKVKITNSRSRWAFSGAGNHLTILHPNGVVTFYGHLAKALVSPGQQVSQGQLIALMGGASGTPGAGKSTGCHLHFGVHNARNPFAR